MIPFQMLTFLTCPYRDLVTPQLLYSSPAEVIVAIVASASCRSHSVPQHLSAFKISLQQKKFGYPLEDFRSSMQTQYSDRKIAYDLHALSPYPEPLENEL